MLLRRLLLNRTLLISVAIASLAVVASVAVVFALSSSDDSDNRTVIAPSPTVTPSPAPSATRTPAPQPSPTAEPEPTVPPTVPGANPADRIVIPAASVDAPITLKAIPPSGGVLPSPIGPDDVVFYDFAGFDGLGGYPGSGGTIVLSGHVDYGGGYCDNGREPPPCTAVFWDLTQLEAGDVVELHLTSGIHSYRVSNSDNIGATQQEMWDDVWTAAESGERIALITCGGDFNRETHEYESRHVVYGERIEAGT